MSIDRRGLDEELSVSDIAAFGQLCSRHRAACLRIAVRVLGEVTDAEDAVQEACLKAFLNRRLFGMRSTFRSWLIRIVLNECYTILRRRRVLSSLALVDTEIASSARTPEDLHLAEELSRALCLHLRSLPVAMRVPLTMQLEEELSIPAVAERLGLNCETTKARLRRARTLLRERLERRSVSPRGIRRASGN